MASTKEPSISAAAEAGPSESEVLARWDQHAQAYAARFGPQGDRAREFWINPALLGLLGSVKKLSVLDAGCGEGYFCRLLADRGAAEVVGIDASSEMLRIARERTPEESAIRYLRGDFQKLSSLKNGRFDAVVSNLVVQDLPRHDLAIAEAARVLKPGGLFIFSILHPCFQAPGAGWQKGENGENLHWRSGRYFEEIATEEELAPDTGIVTYAFHRTLENYFAALTKAGFRVEAISEPRPSAESQKRNPDFERWPKVPLFFLFKARK